MPPDSANEVVLRDGTRVEIRPIRPADRELLREGFSQLSDESRYRRFLTPIEMLSPSQLAYLTEVDHRDHEALIATVSRTGAPAGVARYIREPGSDRAEAAVTVVDPWQGRGLGTALTRELAKRAVANGIEAFTGLLLAENQDMIDLFAPVGKVRITERSGQTLEVEVPLSHDEHGFAEDLRQVLRAIAAKTAELARNARRD